MGFTFDDDAAAKGTAASLSDMAEITISNEAASPRIFPYLGGDELNTSPTQMHHRYVVNVNDLSLEQVETELPELFKILDRYVRPDRQKEKNKKNGPMYYEWWKYWRDRQDLYQSTKHLKYAFALSRVSAQMAIARVSTEIVFADSCVVFAFEDFSPFAVLQSRVHELWARFFSSSMKDDLRYAPSDCFRTFPFPADFESDPALKAAGAAYHAFRAQLMIDRKDGLTKTYNRFHARGETAADISRLRILHAEMDVAVLRAYARSERDEAMAATWDSLADRAAPEFIEQEVDDGKKIKTRLDWPPVFKDEVLARLIALNVTRAAEERAAGLTALAEDDDEDVDEADVD